MTIYIPGIYYACAGQGRVLTLCLRKGQLFCNLIAFFLKLDEIPTKK